MISGAILLGTALAEGGILAYHFLRKLFRKRRAEAAEREQEDEARRRADAERAVERAKEEAGRIRREEEERQRRRQEARRMKIEAIKLKGGLLADTLNRLGDASDSVLQILYLAATQSAVDMDLQTEKALVPVAYPTNRMDLVPVSEVGQLHEALPSELANDDDLFYRKFVDGSLLRMQHYELVGVGKRLYILWDVSGSMYKDTDYGSAQMQLPDGESVLREDFARGIIAGLLSDAVRGQAEYLLRPFDDTVYPLRSAMDREEAARLLEWIVQEGMRGNDTDISKAAHTAISDIRGGLKTEAGMSYILLITDGQDRGGLTRDFLVRSLGEDVKLMVVLIGTDYGPDHPLAPYVVAKY
jgi:hypothetical protein